MFILCLGLFDTQFAGEEEEDTDERRELGAMDATLEDDFLYLLKLPVTFQGKSLSLLVPYTSVEDQVFFEPRDLLLWLGYAEVITSAHCTPNRI